MKSSVFKFSYFAILLPPVLLALTFLNFISIAQAQTASSPTAAAKPSSNWEDAYAQMSIHELVNAEVTTASRRPEKLSDVASAVYVLNSEDIRRSGASTIPDALRLVPGVNVGQLDGNQWAVSIRGFNGVFSDKLLVLIDGRSVYSPLFSGVVWSENDIPLEDVERIEVIRGPGATLWGANAVNGVINIITKSADKTQGMLVSAGGGKEEKAFGHLRFGDRFADTEYRIYAKATTRDENHLVDGGKAHDRWDSYRGGFRSDSKLSSEDTLTVQGDSLYSETVWDVLIPDLQAGLIQTDRARRYNTQNILARWTHNISSLSDFTLQTYWDRVDRDDALIGTRRNTWDIDAQYRFSSAEAHDMLFGVAYRVYRDDHFDTFVTNIDPDSRTLGLYTTFLQDQITIIPDRFKVIVGSKFEQSDLSGGEFLPNIRVVSTPNDRNTIWASISRAVRSPSRFNNDGHIVAGVIPGFAGSVPGAVTINGNRDFESEKLLAYEIGYRAQLHEAVSIDIAGFYNDYNGLATLESSGSPVLTSHEGTPYYDIPTIVTNARNGKVVGGEVALDVRPYEWWRVVGSYSLAIDSDNADDALSTGSSEDPTVRNQFSLRSQINLPHRVELDTTLRYVGSVEVYDIGSYYAVDAHIGWHASQNIELAIVGRNLFHNTQQEFISNQINTARTEIDRAVFGRVTYRF